MSNYNSNIIPYYNYPMTIPLNIYLNYNFIPFFNNYSFYSTMNNNNKFLLSEFNSNFLLNKKHERDYINSEQPIQNLSLNQINNIENQINKKEKEIVISLKEEEEDHKKSDSIKNIENQKNTTKKKRTSHKRNNDEELLQDSFLNHIGKPYSNPIRFFREELPKKKNYNKKHNIKLKNKEQNSNTTAQNPIKGIKRVFPLKKTKINFYGNDYKQTNSPIDFMKYNFDFRLEEQYKTKKLITDYDQQHIDLTRINQKLYENYNSNSQNLNEIEQKWSRKKFVGDNKDLKKVISIIKDSFPGRKLDVNEEKCLNILKNNDYNIEEFLDSRHGK